MDSWNIESKVALNCEDVQHQNFIRMKFLHSFCPIVNAKKEDCLTHVFLLKQHAQVTLKGYF